MFLKFFKWSTLAIQQKTAYFPLATLVVMTRGLSFTQTHSKTHDCT